MTEEVKEQQDQVERALEALKAPQTELGVIDWRPAPPGSGTLKGYCDFRLPNGETLDNCCLSEMGGDKWWTLPVLRTPQPDGSSLWAPRIAFASAAENQAFQRLMMSALDEHLRPVPPLAAGNRTAGQYLQVTSEAAGNVILVGDEKDAQKACKQLNVPRGQVWVPSELALIESLAPALRPGAIAFKRVLGGPLTSEALAAWVAWKAAQDSANTVVQTKKENQETKR